MIKRVIDVIPVQSLVAIGLGYANQDLYYSWFDIEIINYLDFSEILLFFTKDIFLLVLMILIGCFTIMVVSPKFFDNPMRINNKAGKLVFGFVVSIFMMGTSIFVLLNNGFAFVLLMPSAAVVHFLGLFFIIIGTLFLYYLWLPVILKLEIIEKFGRYIFFAIFCSMTLFSFSITNQIKFNNIIGGYSKYHVYLERSNKGHLQTDKSLVFIGSTRNFFFFRHLKYGMNIIIPASEIIEIRIKKIRDNL